MLAGARIVRLSEHEIWTVAANLSVRVLLDEVELSFRLFALDKPGVLPDLLNCRTDHQAVRPSCCLTSLERVAFSDPLGAISSTWTLLIFAAFAWTE
jgi:hypothetical protein